MREPTPRPWEASSRDWRGVEDPHRMYITGGHYIDEEDGTPVCVGVAVVEGNHTSHETTTANTALVLRAVNLHDDLVAMLRKHEWCGPEMYVTRGNTMELVSSCPECNWSRGAEHAPDCALAALLKRAEQ